MPSPSNANPAYPNSITPGYDPLTQQGDIAIRAVNIQTDTSVTPNVKYGDMATSGPTSSTGIPTSVAASASAVALLASSNSRKAAYIYNDSSATLYVGLFAHASLTTSLYTTQVPPNNLYEVPITPVYLGEISGIWSSATGNARITEMS